jgi:hypothetical protein
MTLNRPHKHRGIVNKKKAQQQEQTTDNNNKATKELKMEADGILSFLNGGLCVASMPSCVKNDFLFPNGQYRHVNYLKRDDPTSRRT